MFKFHINRSLEPNRIHHNQSIEDYKTHCNMVKVVKLGQKSLKTL